MKSQQQWGQGQDVAQVQGMGGVAKGLTESSREVSRASNGKLGLLGAYVRPRMNSHQTDGEMRGIRSGSPRRLCSDTEGGRAQAACASITHACGAQRNSGPVLLNGDGGVRSRSPRAWRAIVVFECMWVRHAGQDEPCRT